MRRYLACVHESDEYFGSKEHDTCNNANAEIQSNCDLECALACTRTRICSLSLRIILLYYSFTVEFLSVYNVVLYINTPHIMAVVMIIATGIRCYVILYLTRYLFNSLVTHFEHSNKALLMPNSVDNFYASHVIRYRF